MRAPARSAAAAAAAALLATSAAAAPGGGIEIHEGAGHLEVVGGPSEIPAIVDLARSLDDASGQGTRALVVTIPWRG